MAEASPKIEASWKEQLEGEFHAPYFSALKDFLVSERLKNKVIYPPGQKIFSAFNHTPFENVEYIELPVNFKESVKCGNFFLYGSIELSHITKLIY